MIGSNFRNLSLCNNSIACLHRVNFNYFYFETISVSFPEIYLCGKHYFVWAVDCLKMSLSIRFIVIVIKDSGMRDMDYFITIVNKDSPRTSTIAIFSVGCYPYTSGINWSFVLNGLLYSPICIFILLFYAIHIRLKASQINVCNFQMLK